DRIVAERLYDIGLASLLLDLRTPDELNDELAAGQVILDIGQLARRLIDATDWLVRRPETSGLSIGYFGASIGTAAALVAAGERPSAVGAVVSRGGRPDLAGEATLACVRVPTLLLVGSADARAFEWNRRAKARMSATCSLEMIPGATRQFTEPD